jgi:hypothetical protein
MINVLILGQPYWASRIAQALNSHAGDMRASFIPQRGYVRLLARPPRSERVVIMRAGYRVGSSTPRGRLFDLYWSLLRRSLPAARACHYWLGTDVLNTLEEARAGTLRWAVLSLARDDLHPADAPWLIPELESVGLHATTAHVPQPYRTPSAPRPLPSEFKVLTYLPTDRFAFYGGEAILEVARRLPGVRFDVVGTGGESAPSAPDNVRWHGWVDDLAARYADATVVVRIPRHDGLGATVIEGLLNARHVIYTYEVPFVRTVSPPTPETLAEALGELHDAHGAGRLSPNFAGRSYALEAFNEAKLVTHLMAILRTGT